MLGHFGIYGTEEGRRMMKGTARPTEGLFMLPHQIAALNARHARGRRPMGWLRMLRRVAGLPA
ncbi:MULTISPECIES: hypothetical protein [Paracoccus]|uniref:hypothetical protein n=1 Tax=Paracoccus TaxID=265 RepID=UPI0003B7B088|nr:MULTISPECIES: hypothetical protein [Paracoccus]